MYKQIDNELLITKYKSNKERNEFNEKKQDNEQLINLLKSECNKYQQIALKYCDQENNDQIINASIIMDLNKQILINDGLIKGNKILQKKYNDLDKKFKKLNNKKNNNKNNGNELSQYQLENIIIDEKKINKQLRKEIHVEKQKYFERVIRFKDDLDTLYKKTENAAQENNKMKQDAKKKTFELQRENDKLRDSLKQSHSNLRVKQTEAESKHKRSVKYLYLFLFFSFYRFTL